MTRRTPSTKTLFRGDNFRVLRDHIDDESDRKRPHMPWVDPSVFRKAKRESTAKQGDLEL